MDAQRLVGRALTGAGMGGGWSSEPRSPARVDKELRLAQQEYRIGEPGKIADQDRMTAKEPT